jgi:putative flippase GtrA
VPSPSPSGSGGALRARGGTFVRYAAGSVVAFGCSEVVLIGAYTLFSVGARTSAILAWVAGAVPNYILNRRWAWRKKGRATFLRETLPYWVITLGTAAFAVAATSLADGWVHRSVSGRGEQSLLFGGVYFLAYGVVFVVKFLLFDKLVFGKRGRAESDSGRLAGAEPEPLSSALPAPAASSADR